MICGHFHEGSGLGNQLARYVFTRVKALDLGVPFGMIGKFKGDSFLKIDKGEEHLQWGNLFNEERVNNEQGVDIRPFDRKSLEIRPFTLVDGEFQSEKYWKHREDEVREWLRPIHSKSDCCVINFRGGEYVGVKDLFLPKEYWDAAIAKILEIDPTVGFRVVTDDIETAKKFFDPQMPITHDLSDYAAIWGAKYLIISNSSFAIFPALLGESEVVISPKFWAGYNVGYWKLPQNEYSKFTYIHHEH